VLADLVPSYVFPDYIPDLCYVHLTHHFAVELANAMTAETNAVLIILL
jgi:hypothetical protein